MALRYSSLKRFFVLWGMGWASGKEKAKRLTRRAIPWATNKTTYAPSKMRDMAIVADDDDEGAAHRSLALHTSARLYDEHTR